MTLTACQLYANDNYADVFPRLSRFWRHIQIVLEMSRTGSNDILSN